MRVSTKKKTSAIQRQHERVVVERRSDLIVRERSTEHGNAREHERDDTHRGFKNRSAMEREDARRLEQARGHVHELTLESECERAA
jgi:hypothetical protein